MPLMTANFILKDLGGPVKALLGLASYETFGVYDSLGVHTNESLSTSPISKLIFEGKFKRIINMQKRWKEQLEVQRRKIYNSTSFLKE